MVIWSNVNGKGGLFVFDPVFQGTNTCSQVSSLSIGIGRGCFCKRMETNIFKRQPLASGYGRKRFNTNTEDYLHRERAVHVMSYRDTLSGTRAPRSSVSRQRPSGHVPTKTVWTRPDKERHEVWQGNAGCAPCTGICFKDRGEEQLGGGSFGWRRMKEGGLILSL